MTFGAKEVMVIAALAFGIVVTGCSSTPDASISADLPLRVYGTVEEMDCKFCFSRYELEFYYPKGLPKRASITTQAVKEEVHDSPAEQEEMLVRIDNYSNFVSTWVPSLPSFLK